MGLSPLTVSAWPNRFPSGAATIGPRREKPCTFLRGYEAGTVGVRDWGLRGSEPLSRRRAWEPWPLERWPSARLRSERSRSGGCASGDWRSTSSSSAGAGSASALSLPDERRRAPRGTDSASCRPEAVLALDNLGRPFADDHAGSHRVRRGHQWHDGPVGDPELLDAVDLETRVDD